MRINQLYAFQLPGGQRPQVINESRGTYLVGIEYDCPYEDGGYFDFKRTATMEEVAREVLDIIEHGHTFPTFPPSANPIVLFASVLDDNNRDCREELIIVIRNLNSKEKG